MILKITLISSNIIKSIKLNDDNNNNLVSSADGSTDVSTGRIKNLLKAKTNQKSTKSKKLDFIKVKNIKSFIKMAFFISKTRLVFI